MFWVHRDGSGAADVPGGLAVHGLVGAAGARRAVVLFRMIQAVGGSMPTWWPRPSSRYVHRSGRTCPGHRRRGGRVRPGVALGRWPAALVLILGWLARHSPGQYPGSGSWRRSEWRCSCRVLGQRTLADRAGQVLATPPVVLPTVTRSRPGWHRRRSWSFFGLAVAALIMFLAWELVARRSSSSRSLAARDFGDGHRGDRIRGDGRLRRHYLQHVLDQPAGGWGGRRRWRR